MTVVRRDIGKRVLAPWRGRLWSIEGVGRDHASAWIELDSGERRACQVASVVLAQDEKVYRCKYCGDWTWCHECAVCGR